MSPRPLKLPLLLLTALILGAGCKSAKKGAGESESKAQAKPLKTAIDARAAASGDLGYGDDARLFDSAALAVAEILKDEPRVLGFGEFHKLTGSAQVRSALRRFADEIFDVIGPRSAHLVLETWAIDPSCGERGKEVTAKVEAAIERPKETESEMQTLLRKTAAYGMRGHLLAFGCDEYSALLGEEGLKTEALLQTVSAKLGEKTRSALDNAPEDKMVVVYGGATHNDLYPYKGLEAWSYAQGISDATEKAYVEVDLYVPELVEGDALLEGEAWYPLLAEARSEQVILIRRDQGSYILILRKGLAEALSGNGQDDRQEAQEEHEGATQNTGAAHQ